MPLPLIPIALGTAARVAGGVALRGAATTARFGMRGAATTGRGIARGTKGAGRSLGRAAVIGSSLSSSQFNATNPSANSVTEPLRFGADMRVGTE